MTTIGSDEDSEDIDNELRSHSYCNRFRTCWLWRKFISAHSAMVAPIENVESKRPPERVLAAGNWQLEVKPSPGMGLGVFAVSKMPAGTFLGCYSGEILTEEEVDARPESAYLWEVGEGSGWYIDADNETGDWTRYMNHISDHPNVEPFDYPDAPATSHTVVCADGQRRPIQVAPGPRLEFWTVREIAPGEELRYDYGDAYLESLKEELALVGKRVVA
mmetsp:Transcript_6490/g.10398  ORF Transcript_6490/g.10398 Transcript_6490/m.10398 type:complete len:218 (+) Transcript_6490:171-824(+)|eukprot:CAMPEP_0169195868 /NCGR_PEP_ID=MMETSP1016-20121227/7437_1 /TAXON_ID=342587 /ORGANISM="Karlodinium micrum, Strain CCMP2283" /LENGTH=217 /DNA_ID=CAMNT_0009272423 /DNA_START=168 /DNA_END=821 /DNA_ORIENTATION=-